ncbi:MAG: glycosyltransferase family 2 protein [Clostridia bacterium]|nr:glycosyltransferase family 2 protein [Clostridia bacterium]
MGCPVLYLVLPCCNEQDTLPRTVPQFRGEIQRLIDAGEIAADSKILFVNDGSTDGTWAWIDALCETDALCGGISLSRNEGHQRALYAGIMEARGHCDLIVTADCDGQDDIRVLEEMLGRWREGADIVLGIRKSRRSDTPGKRGSARLFYRLLHALGVQTVCDHADFRLMTTEAADALAQFSEVHLYLRGLVPLIGFQTAEVFYDRGKRQGGKSHYPFRRMVSLALDAVTGFSVRPLRIISGLGFLVSLLSFIGIIWIFWQHFSGNTVSGWSSTLCIVCFVSGVQLISLGVVGEYIGRIYMEVKGRPRYIIAKRTDDSTDDLRRR